MAHDEAFALDCYCRHLADNLGFELPMMKQWLFSCSISPNSQVTSVYSIHSCIGWRCRIASSLCWLFWYTDAYTRQLRRTLLRNSISHLLTRLVSVSALHRHNRLLSHAPVFQPSAIELFRSLLSVCGTLCRWTSRRCRQYLFSGNSWRPISSVIISCRRDSDYGHGRRTH